METVLSMVVDFYKFNGVVKVLQSHSSRGFIFRLHISGCKSWLTGFYNWKQFPAFSLLLDCL